MKKINIVLSLFALILCACTEGKDVRVEYYGASFICPAGWSVSETEDYGDYQYICVEKKGFDSSGIVTIFLTNEEYELEEYLQNQINALKERAEFSNLQSQNPTKCVFGKYSGIGCKYSASVMLLPLRGSVQIFNANGKTVCILLQEALEDAKANKHGFETIRESLTIN
jgi:hypothetical protein